MGKRSFGLSHSRSCSGRDVCATRQSTHLLFGLWSPHAAPVVLYPVSPSLYIRHRRLLATKWFPMTLCRCGHQHRASPNRASPTQEGVVVPVSAAGRTAARQLRCRPFCSRLTTARHLQSTWCDKHRPLADGSHGHQMCCLRLNRVSGSTNGRGCSAMQPSPMLRRRRKTQGMQRHGSSNCCLE